MYTCSTYRGSWGRRLSGVALDVVSARVHGEGIEPPGVRGACGRGRGGGGGGGGGGKSVAHVCLCWVGGGEELEECLTQLFNLQIKRE